VSGLSGANILSVNNPKSVWLASSLLIILPHDFDNFVLGNVTFEITRNKNDQENAIP
jgi:hypothetical protein